MVLFPQRLKELRTSRNLSLQELADIVNMSKSSVYMWETGEREPGLEILEAIADYFNVDYDYLIGKSDIPNRALSFYNEEYRCSAKLPAGSRYSPTRSTSILLRRRQTFRLILH